VLAIKRCSTNGLSGLCVTERISGLGVIHENVRCFEKSTVSSKSEVTRMVAAQPASSRHTDTIQRLNPVFKSVSVPLFRVDHLRTATLSNVAASR
jgi:hypothetical protein